MAPALIAACLWVVAATVTALLPMRYQYAPGLTLLIAAPALLIWIALTTNPWLAVAATFAVLSMFRKPLAYFARKAFAKDHGG